MRRAIQPCERERLEQLARALEVVPWPWTTMRRGLAGLLAGLFAVGLPTCLIAGLRFGSPEARVALLAPAWTLALLLAGGAWVRAVVERLERRAALRSDALEGEVEVREHGARRAWVLARATGPSYALELDGARILFLTGDSLRVQAAGDSPPFPTRRLRLVRAPRSGALLRVEPVGERLAAERVLDAAELGATLPSDGALLPGVLDTLEEGVRYLGP